jgi:O-antigen/teichoic acid export membrane protein
MRVKLMFRQFSGRATAAGLFRQGTTIGFAYGGFGVMSLAWPVLLTGLFESVSAYITLPEKLWKRKMEVSRWGKILRESRWAMFASLSNFAVDWGPFLTLPLLTTATKAMQGYFAFAWNITAQLGILLSWGMMFILTPVFARMNDDPKRQADAVIRAMRAVMMIGSAGCMALGAMMAPTEHLLWHGKWEQTVFAVVLLGAFFPWRITFGLTAALLQAQGRFKLYAVLTLAEGLGLTIAVTAAASMDPRADSMAWGAGLWLLVSRLAVCVYVFGRMGISVRAVLGSTLPAWTIALIASAAAIAVDHFFMEPSLVSDDPRKSFSPQLVDIVRVIATGGITSLLCLVGMRVVLRRHIEDALSLVPVRMQRLARKMLVLPAVKASL